MGLALAYEHHALAMKLHTALAFFQRSGLDQPSQRLLDVLDGVAMAVNGGDGLPVFGPMRRTKAEIGDQFLPRRSQSTHGSHPTTLNTAK